MLFLLYCGANMPGLDQRTLLAQSLGGSSGGLLKADLRVIFVVQLVAHQGTAFVLDTAAPSVTHTGPDRPRIEEVCLLCVK